MKAGPYVKLEDLPGVGKSIAQDLRLLGYKKPSDLVGENPEKSYERWMKKTGVKERCMLYVLRCIVYALQTPPEKRNPKLLNWWAWKDDQLERT